MDDLVAFLRARYDEDERIARAADADLSTVFSRIDCFDTEMAADERHIMAHGPSRVLREIDAKRRIVDLHGIVHREIGWLENGEEEHGEIPVCGLCVPKHSNYQRREDVPAGPCLTLRLLALPCVDHENYREEWRP